MNHLVIRILFIIFIFSLSNGARCDSPSINSELDGLLQRLSVNATSEQYNQIFGAVKASPALRTQLNELATSRKLTEIRVLAPEAIPMSRGVRFGASVEGTQFFLSTSLLKELLKNRTYDVVKANDIYPDNCVFVLSHLAFHVASSQEMEKLDGEMKRRIEELSKTTGQHDYTEILRFGASKRLENESAAFIKGWNQVVDAATQSNGNQTLSIDQVSTLLMNLRYRFAFHKALQLPENSLLFSNTGMVEMNERNVKAIATALSTSKMADIQ